MKHPQNKAVRLWDARKKLSESEFKAACKELDEIVRDLFAHGGPQRPSSIGTYRQRAKSTLLLEAEQQRLIRTWNKREK